MKQHHLVLLFAFLLSGSSILAQQKYTISGYVREKGSRELLPGVNVYLAAQRLGAATNNYGFYSLTLPEGKYEIQYSYVGYQIDIKQINLNESVVIDIELNSSITLTEVVVSAEKQERITESNQMSMISLPVSQVKSIPALLGEKDVFKALQLMPGVQKGSEGSSGLYVRGGGPDQNLIILDDAPVYNAYHLFGFFSIFNGDALKSIELTKGGFPARYGGRLSSVVEMTMKDGNKEKFSGEAGIGLIASRFVFEGPIIKNKASFLVSARRTYIDALIRPFLQGDDVAGYYFYDLNAKLNYDFSPKNKLYVSGYFGRDKFHFSSKNYDDGYDKGGLYWQNKTATVRWNHLFNNRVFSNTSFIFSEYDLNIYSKYKSSYDNYSLTYKSGIRDFAIKYDLEFHPSPIYTFRTGFQSTHHHFLPSAIVEIDNQTSYDFNSKTVYNSLESGLYIENHFNFSGRLQLNAGLRLSHFIAEEKHYFSPEPRLSVNYLISEGLSAKVAYAEMNQYIHLLSNTGVGLPTDLWVPSTDRVSPQKSRQVSGGLAKELPKYNSVVTLEGYYKKSTNILGYKPGASFLLLDDPSDAQNFTWQDNVTSGKGDSYGAELLLHKKLGKTSGWIGYTLSWTQLQFDEINFGKKFWARHDRRHDISLVLIHELSEKITLSGTWVYGTGSAITLPLGSFPANTHNPFEQFNSVFGYYYNYSVSDYGAVNDFRMKPYHRLDLAIQFHKKFDKYERTWELGLYNAYNRKNPFFYYIEDEYYSNDTQISKLKQVSIFPVIPSVTYNIKF
ncbi:MAG: TonB-dependent receptor [Bacteroidetes bacterium HGW-Bacteroidetes-1]|nr:MAG: TonB-dependent receptor [Bacteroidetes bacterium HGW-Bacteroidetes-1]